jgi:hypothetical protein
MRKKLLLIGLLGLFGATVVMGQPPAVKQRQVNHQKRISAGLNNGSLTKGEFIRLQQQERAINRSKRRAACDGKVTRWERTRLHREQNAANRNIYRKKHNGWNRN